MRSLNAEMAESSLRVRAGTVEKGDKRGRNSRLLRPERIVEPLTRLFCGSHQSPFGQNRGQAGPEGARAAAWPKCPDRLPRRRAVFLKE